MELAELLEREAIADGDQLLDWARGRAAALVADLDAEDDLRSLLDAGREHGFDVDREAVPVTRRRRREPSSPQPKSADELPPPPEHPRLAEGEPEPVLETVDTGPIDLEDEIVRRRLREDSWALAAREVEAYVEREPARPIVEAVVEVAKVEETQEASVELEIEIDVAIEATSPAEPVEATQELPVHVEPAEATQELPVHVEPAESAQALPIVAEPAEAANAEQHDDSDSDESDDEFEVDDLDELEVEELDELDEAMDEEEEAASAPKPPRPPPPKSAPPPIRNEVADLIASLSEPVRTGSTAVTRLDEIEGAPKPIEDLAASEGIDIDIE